MFLVSQHGVDKANIFKSSYIASSSRSIQHSRGRSESCGGLTIYTELGWYSNLNTMDWMQFQYSSFVKSKPQPALKETRVLILGMLETSQTY
jgi:hypothetical protein